eukprot:215285-Rhodomonas_salina.1
MYLAAIPPAVPLSDNVSTEAKTALTKDQGSRDKGQGSRVEGQGSRVKGQRSRVKGQGSKVKGQRSKVKGQGVCVESSARDLVLIEGRGEQVQGEALGRGGDHARDVQQDGHVSAGRGRRRRMVDEMM